MATEQERRIAEREALLLELEALDRTFAGECVGVEHRSVHREMTTVELLDARERFADLRGKIADLEGEKKMIDKQYDGRIKPLNIESDRLLLAIRSRIFDIEEDCYVFNDYEANKVRYVSKTTCGIVYVRDMTGADRQRAIDFDNGTENEQNDGDKNEN